MSDFAIRSNRAIESGSSSLSSVEHRPRSYRPDIDGLRSLAILSVVLYHAGVVRISGGFTGVDVFFAISGYLIGGHINAELVSGAFRFSTFYKNRAKRILPALYVVLATVLLIGLVLFSPRELRDLTMYTISTTVSASNILLWRSTGYFAPSADLNPLLMTWSLGVEEQFYLVIPILLVLIAKVRQRLIFPAVILVSLLSFASAIYQVRHNPNSAFYLLTSRAWELGIGVALAIFEAHGHRLPVLSTRYAKNFQGWAGLALVLTPFFVLRETMPFPGMAALPSVVGASLLLSSRSAWVNRKLLSFSPLVFIGRVSYSFYLVHWPILSLLRILNGQSFSQTQGLSALAVAFALAVLSYYCVEKPFRLSKLGAGPLLWRYAFVSLLLLLSAGTIYEIKDNHRRDPSAALADNSESAVTGSDRDVCLVKSGASTPNLAPACAGAQTADRRIALWGDSHASALATALRLASSRQGYFMEEYAKTSCPPLYGVGRSYRLRPAEAEECINFNRVVLQRLIVEPKVEVILLAAHWDGAFDPRYTDEGKLVVSGHDPTLTVSQAETETLLDASLASTLRALVAANKQVIVLGDTPTFQIDPVWRMRTRQNRVRWTLSNMLNRDTSGLDPGSDTADDDTPPQIAGRRLVQQTALSIPGVHFWDMRSNFCDERDRCAYRDGQTALFADTNHLTTQGASRLLKGWVIPPR